MKTDIKYDANLQPVSETGQPHFYTHDPVRNLLWLKDDAHPHPVTAAKADQIIKDLRIGGFDDWQLGSDEELSSRVDRTRYRPAADLDTDNVRPDWYWTRTPAAWFASARWCVDFGGGGVFVSVGGGLARVRAVRSWSGPAPVGQ